MNITDMAFIIGLIAGLITIFAWFWKLVSWFQKRNIETKNRIEEGNQLAEQLLSKATTPANRADIHFYMNLRSIQISKRQIISTIHFIAMGMTIFIETFGLVVIFSLYHKVLFDEHFKLSIVLILLQIVMLLSYFIMLWFSLRANKIENGWETGVMKTIENMMGKHFTDS